MPITEIGLGNESLVLIYLRKECNLIQNLKKKFSKEFNVI